VKKIEFIPLTQETRELLKTEEAAPHLRMTKSCLRTKVDDPDFPIRPVRIMRHLLWRTADIKALLGVQ